jgi:3-isopropylmalate/(R)-2-methylmalate dehydratase large subunit
MGATLIEKILSAHTGRPSKAGDIVDVAIDARIARDFGGANVVKNIETYGLGIADPGATFFTFDCNPTGSDQRYAANQQKIRVFAEKHGIRVYDITEGIGTHIAIDESLIGPGATMVSTDSHANIVGAIGAFGQGMGDQDVAYAFSSGKVWFKVPPTKRILIEGRRPGGVSAKDVTLALVGKVGPSGLLGYAAEIYGDAVEDMSLSERITLASMATEMAAIIILFPPNAGILHELESLTGKTYDLLQADRDARYEGDIRLDITGLEPQVSLPGNPANVVPLKEAMGTRINSAFIGSCTNGRFEDLRAAAWVLEGRQVAPGVVLKIVPSTDRIWRRCLDEGILAVFKDAGALIGNAGCAGCAAGQIGQNGPGEVTVSTGNRNFPGKQGQGLVFLASPEVVAASAVRGFLVGPAEIDSNIPVKTLGEESPRRPEAAGRRPRSKPATQVRGRVWIIDRDNIDTDMIYHNKHLAVTEVEEMGKHCFGNLEGFADFPEKARPGDIVIAGANFGCGSSRQHAVDCFKSLGIQAVIAKSFGAIYERNAINAGLPILEGDLGELGIKDGDVISVSFPDGTVTDEKTGRTARVRPFSTVQLDIYERGGLLEK